jgi:hypothetical protein
LSGFIVQDVQSEALLDGYFVLKAVMVFHAKLYDTSKSNK